MSPEHWKGRVCADKVLVGSVRTRLHEWVNIRSIIKIGYY